MTIWLLVHLLALGVWIGCIATEGIVEHAVGGEAERDYVANVHWPIDLYVETPSFVLVAISGAMLWRSAHIDRPLVLMALAGFLAVACNAVCVGVVHARRRARRRGDASAYARLDDLQHKLGAVLVLFIALALALGIHRIVG